MAVTDFVYLGLIVVGGALSYWRGFRVGSSRSRKLCERIFKSSETFTELPPPPQDSQVVVLRGTRAFFSSSDIRGVFGNN
jgi:hypothetical protein